MEELISHPPQKVEDLGQHLQFNKVNLSALTFHFMTSLILLATSPSTC